MILQIRNISDLSGNFLTSLIMNRCDTHTSTVMVICHCLMITGTILVTLMIQLKLFFRYVAVC